MQTIWLRGLYYRCTTVVGAEEAKNRSVNIRNRDDQSTQAKGELVPIDEAITKLQNLKAERRLENKLS